MKLQSTPEIERLIGYMNAMSICLSAYLLICLDGCNYVTGFSAKSIAFNNEIDFTGLEILGRTGTAPDLHLQEIIRLAYPESKPDLAAIVDSNHGVMRGKLGRFIAYINEYDGARSLVVPKKKDLARGFWQHVEACVDLNQTRILEYTPALGENDELGRFIFWGFTFLMFNEARQECLILHYGAAD